MSALKNAIKQFFETGDYPTEAQFLQLFNTIFFKDEQIPLENLGEVEELLQQIVAPVTYSFQTNGTYQVPAGYNVYKIFAKTPNSSTITVAATQGTDDIIYQSDITGNVSLPIAVDIPADTAKNIFFNVPQVSGVVTTVLKIYLQRI